MWVKNCITNKKNYKRKERLSLLLKLKFANINQNKLKLKEKINNYYENELNYKNINYKDVSIANFYQLLKSDNKLNVYSSLYFMNKIVSCNNYLINYFFDNNIFNYFDKYILNFNEPQIQILILKSIISIFIKKNIFIYYWVTKHIYFENYINLINSENFKIKKLLLFIYIIIIKEDKFLCKLFFNKNMIIRIINEFKNSVDINVTFANYFLIFIKNLILKSDFSQYTWELLESLKILIVKSKNLINIFDSISIINDLLDNKNYNIFNDIGFFNKLYYIIKINLNNEYKIKKILVLLLKFSFLASNLSNLIIKHILQKVLVQILTIHNTDLNLIIYKILSNLCLDSRKSFKTIINIPFFYDFFSKILYTEDSEPLLLEQVFLFCTFSKNLTYEDLEFIINKDYLSTIIHFLSNYNNEKLALLLLDSLKYILWINKNLNFFNDNDSIQIILDNSDINSLFKDLRNRYNIRVSNKISNILKNYF